MSKKKRWIIAAAVLIVILCVVILPSPYSHVDFLDGIWMEAVESQTTSDVITVQFHNETGAKHYRYDSWYRIERKAGPFWLRKPLNPLVLISGTDYGGVVKDSRTVNYDIGWQYGKLLPGRYRIIICAKNTNPTDKTDYYLTAEFKI